MKIRQDREPAIALHFQQAQYSIRRFSHNHLMISVCSEVLRGNSGYLQFHCASTTSDNQKLVLEIERSVAGEAAFLNIPNDIPVSVSDPLTGELLEGLLASESLLSTNPAAINYAVRLLCAQLADTHAASRGAELRFEDWQARAVSRSLQIAIKNDYTVEDIASQCGLSVCHFSRVFKATYGMPVYQLILQERIRVAQVRLQTTNDSITEIALDTGFSDQSSFTRRFTAVTGVPPAAWRKFSASKSIVN